MKAYTTNPARVAIDTMVVLLRQVGRRCYADADEFIVIEGVRYHITVPEGTDSSLYGQQLAYEAHWNLDVRAG